MASAMQGASPNRNGPLLAARHSRQRLMMAFEQATIKVQKEAEFAKLQAAVEQAFLPEKTERFLKQLNRKGIRVRDFDGVLAARALEDAVASQADLSAWQLYQALPVSD